MTLAQKNFKLFKEYCKKYLVALNLTDWVVNYKLEENPQDAAWVEYNTEHKSCTISLDALIASNAETTVFDIERSSAEEVLHLLLARLTDLAEKRTVRDGEILEEEHAVIKKLIHGIVVVPGIEKIEKKTRKREK
jgi:hypothetical protein